MTHPGPWRGRADPNSSKSNRHWARMYARKRAERTSFAPEVRAESEPHFTRSGNRFPTYDQASMYLADLASQYPWMRTRVVPTSDSPNREWIDGRLRPPLREPR